MSWGPPGLGAIGGCVGFSGLRVALGQRLGEDTEVQEGLEQARKQVLGGRGVTSLVAGPGHTSGPGGCAEQL